MKRNIIKAEKKIWLVLLAMVGILTGCSTKPSKTDETKGYDDPVPTEYGCPHAEYVINLNVSDEQGKAIRGVEVEFIDSAENYFPKEISDSLGNTTYGYGGFPGGKTVLVRIRDIDGKTNGKFEDFDTNVVFGPGDLIDENDDTWDQGEAYKDVKIKLKKK